MFLSERRVNMRMINKNDFLNRSFETLNEIFDMLTKLLILQLNDIQGMKAALVIIDMINGFAREGALKSSRVEEIIPKVTELSKKCGDYGILKLAFADCHTDTSTEFDSYPAHCIMGSNEGEIVDEIKEIGGYTLIYKNSTNGFFEEEFQKWLKQYKNINTFIITGDCSDICVL